MEVDKDGNKTDKTAKTAKVLASVGSNAGLENLMKVTMEKVGWIKLIKVGQGSEDPLIEDHTIDVEFRRRHKNWWEMDRMMSNLLKTEILLDYDVICCKCPASSSSLLDELQFPFAFVDEAATITESDFLMTTLRRVQAIFEVGDEAQLPAIVSDTAKENGLGVSFCECIVGDCRVFDGMFGGASLTIRLDKSYRPHPSLWGMTSKSSYNGLLHPGTPSSKRPFIDGFEWPTDLVPAALICIDGTGEKVGNSFTNEAEAVKVLQLVIGFLIAQNVDPFEIVIMSAYSAQVLHAKNKILQQTTSENVYRQPLPQWLIDELKKARCCTVDAF